MADFNIKIAGHGFRVLSLFESTRDYCRAYLTENAPECTIAVTREDLTFEQEALRQEALEEGMRVRVFTDPFLERTAIQHQVADFLFRQNILMLHGSAIAVDGEGYLFTAKCGTGKSTHTRLWQQRFGDRAVMVNDDKPFVELREDSVLLHGSPWSGKHGLDANICVPLKGICILQRGAKNKIGAISPEDALPMLQKQAYLPPQTTLLPLYHPLLTTLSDRVSLWRMACNKEIEAAEVAYAAMSEK